MNKSIWYYLPVLLLLGGYFYLTKWLNNNFNEAVKFDQKVEHDDFGKQVTKLNVQEAVEKDFYIVIDSHKTRTFFRVLGKTNDSQLAIQYGKDSNLLPNTLDYNSYLKKNTYYFLNISFDKVINWVEEIVNKDENFGEKISLYTQNELDEILRNNVVIGFTKGEKHEVKNPLFMGEFTWDLRVRYLIGDPIIIFPLIILILTLFWIIEKVKIVYFSSKRITFYYFFVLVSLGMFAYIFAHDLVGPTYIGGSNWYSIIYIFVSYVFAFYIIQWFQNTLKIKDFAKRQVILIFFIITIGLLIEIVIKSIVNYVFYKNNPINEFQDGLATTIFWIFTGSFKNWLMIATANFLHNLIRYIYTLRRKSKQLQAVTSDAQLSADALQQSETHVNSHFLYNSLHSIAALAPVAPVKTETLALSLAKYYRYTTNRNDETWVEIKKEVEALTAYLEVEKIRMGEKLKYSFDIADESISFKVPKFLLLPLVENAIKYGYNSESDITQIKIVVLKMDHNTLKISVCESGHPFSDTLEIGIGIRHVKDMLKRFYPETHSISFINEPVKCVEIVLNTKKINQ